MPTSSYLHSYLADVMEKTGDEHAVAEYATALILDPENRPALRSYPRLLLEKQDLRGALYPRFDHWSDSGQTLPISVNSCRL